MSILDRFRSKKKYSDWVWGMFGGSPPTRNVQGFLKAYGEIGWLYAVVFRIALGCSEVKWTLQNVSNREKPVQVYDHNILKLLDLVNPTLTSPEFIAMDTIYQELIGESFWILNYNALGEPAEIVLAYPHLMKVIPDKKNYIKGYLYGEPPNQIPFSPNEVIHFKYPSPLDQMRGLGPAQSIAIDLDAEQYSAKWNRNFFYNSARPDGVIQFDYNLSDEQFERIRTQWREKHQGVNKAHQVALLEGGGKYQQIQNTVKDMDFSNLKLRNRDVILGVYGMPLSVMGISENVNKANAEAGEYTFARWIVKPRLDWKAAKLQEQLLPKFKNSQNLKVGFEEVVPQTLEQKVKFAESGMKSGYITINEARTLQGLDPLPDGDVLLIPMNMTPTKSDEIYKEPEPVPDQLQPFAGQDNPPKEEEIPGAPPKSKGLSGEEKAEYWEKYAAKTSRQEEAFKRVFLDVFHSQKEDILTYWRTNQDLPSTLDDNKTAKRFEPVIEMVYGDGYESAKLLDPSAHDWILLRSLELAKNINKTTLTALRVEIATGFELGESIPQISKRIQGYFTERAAYRAETIARTEVIAASNEGALKRYEAEDVDKVEFYPAPDACEECLDLVGEYAAKDSHGVIPVHPRCRCTWLPVV